MGLFFISRQEFSKMQQSNKKVRKKLRGQMTTLKRRMDGCDVQHQTHVDHNRRHDDATKSLTKAIEDLTLVIQNIKKEKEADNIIISRAKDNYTAWDVIVDIAKKVSAVVGAGLVLASAGYGILHYMEII